MGCFKDGKVENNIICTWGCEGYGSWGDGVVSNEENVCEKDIYEYLISHKIKI